MSNLVEKLRRENNERDKLLTKENNSLMTDMVVYLRGSNLYEYDIEVIRRELFAMLYEAQDRGETAEFVIGKDFKGFCNELARNGRQKRFYDRFLEWANILVIGIGFLLFVEMLFTGFIVELFQHHIFEMPISLGFILSSLLCIGGAVMIYYYFTKYSFELPKKGVTRSKMILGISTGFIFSGSVALKVFLRDINLFQINFMVPTILIVVAFLLLKIMEMKHTEQIAQTHH